MVFKRKNNEYYFTIPGNLFLENWMTIVAVKVMLVIMHQVKKNLTTFLKRKEVKGIIVTKLKSW